MRWLLVMLVACAHAPARETDYIGRCYRVGTGYWATNGASNSTVPVAAYLEGPPAQANGDDGPSLKPNTVLEVIGLWAYNVAEEPSHRYVYGYLIAHDHAYDADVYAVDLLENNARALVLRHAPEVSCGTSWWTAARFDAIEKEIRRVVPTYRLDKFVPKPH